MNRPRPMTLRELQRAVKRSLEERFELPVWVSAEISELKRNYSGHCYLELVEKGGSNGVPTAQARAVIWNNSYLRIAEHFERETGQPLAPGLQILAKVLVSYHEIYGFSLQITDIDPSYTLGDMERQRQQTIRQLQNDGVWEMNRQAAAAAVMQRIAVVSSAQAAGYRDFCKELDKSPYRFRLTLFDAYVQGAEAENSIVAALCAVAERAEAFDAVALIRGGGSQSDLNCFNAYRLCSHVAQFPLPVVTGIGHDKDTSVADLVAFRALKTPTAVAGWFVERAAAFEAGIARAAASLHAATLRQTHDQRLRLERAAGDLGRLCGQRIAAEKARAAERGPQLAAAVRELLTRQRLRLGRAGDMAEAHRPERLLRLGFALVHSGGRILQSASETQPGEGVEIRFADGMIEATVQKKTIWQRK